MVFLISRGKETASLLVKLLNREQKRSLSEKPPTPKLFSIIITPVYLLHLPFQYQFGQLLGHVFLRAVLDNESEPGLVDVQPVHQVEQPFRIVSEQLANHRRYFFLQGLE